MISLDLSALLLSIPHQYQWAFPAGLSDPFIEECCYVAHTLDYQATASCQVHSSEDFIVDVIMWQGLVQKAVITPPQNKSQKQCRIATIYRSHHVPALPHWGHSVPHPNLWVTTTPCLCVMVPLLSEQWAPQPYIFREHGAILNLPQLTIPSKNMFSGFTSPAFYSVTNMNRCIFDVHFNLAVPCGEGKEGQLHLDI